MSDLTIESRPPITVTIAPSDPVLSGVVSEFAATLNFLSAQIASAVDSVNGKVSQSQLADLSDLVSAVRDSVTTLEAVIVTKAAADHTQPISSVTGLDQQLAQIAQQLLALQGGEDLANQIAALQALIAAKVDRSELNALDVELDGLDDNLQSLSQALAAKANATHGHSIAAIDGLAAALSSLQNAGGAAVAQLVYTLSQSAVRSADEVYRGNFSKLTDSDFQNGVLTELVSNSWFAADLGAVKTIERVELGGGGFAGTTNLAGVLNTSVVQASLNNLDWTPLFAIAGVQNDRISNFTCSIKARYLRVFRAAGGTGATEFRIWGF